MSISVAIIRKGRREGTGPFADDPAPFAENSGRSWNMESRANAALSRLRSLAVFGEAVISFGQFNFFRATLVSLQSVKIWGNGLAKSFLHVVPKFLDSDLKELSKMNS